MGSDPIYPGLLMADNSTDGWIGDKEIPGRRLMVGSDPIYPGLLMADNSTDGWIGDKEIPEPETDGGVGWYLSNPVHMRHPSKTRLA